MPETWFTADTHFGHANIIKYCQRPFLSEQERVHCQIDPRGRWRVAAETVQNHDDGLMDSINSRVQPNDTLWILGDFCWGEHEAAKSYVERIRCNNVNFVWGNHDHRSIESLFGRTLEQGSIKVQGQRIWLNHYPMRSWDGRFHGSWHLYGHVHNRMTDEDQANLTMLTKDVGVDACDYKPISFAELAEYMKPRIAAFEEMKARITGDSAQPTDRLD